jgi:predicted transcriptional regulator
MNIFENAPGKYLPAGRMITIIKTRKMDNSDIILKTLRDNGALKSGEIAEKSGISKADVDKVIKKLLKEDKVYSPKRCFYDIK